MSTVKNNLKRQIITLMGAGLIEVELDDAQLELAITLAVERLRQHSDAGGERAYLSLTLQPEQYNYKLPDEVLSVIKINRRGVGQSIGTGVDFDPFSAVASNAYMLQPHLNGGLATYELYAEYRETVGRLFGSEFQYEFNPVTHNLYIPRKISIEETILLDATILKPIDIMILDPKSGPWIRNYAVAQSKLMLGTAYNKFKNIPGPSGSVTMNGDELRADAEKDLTKLEEELRMFIPAGGFMPFILG